MATTINDANSPISIPDFDVLEDTTPILTAQLKDSDGTNLTLANLNTITLTLYIPKTGLIVNLRDAQDVKNANDVVISAAGLLTWTVQPEDTEILIADADNEREIHRALFEFTRMATDLQGKKRVDLIVHNLDQVP